MNNLDLNAMGVSELNEVEMNEAQGGFLFLACLGALFLGFITGYVIDKTIE